MLLEKGTCDWTRVRDWESARSAHVSEHARLSHNWLVLLGMTDLPHREGVMLNNAIRLYQLVSSFFVLLFSDSVLVLR